MWFKDLVLLTGFLREYFQHIDRTVTIIIGKTYGESGENECNKQHTIIGVMTGLALPFHLYQITRYSGYTT